MKRGKRKEDKKIKIVGGRQEGKRRVEKKGGNIEEKDRVRKDRKKKRNKRN